MFFENIKIGFDKLMNLILLDSRPLKTNKLDFMLREISIREKNNYRFYRKPHKSRNRVRK